MWEKDVKINEVKEIRVKSNVYFGVGAINAIVDISIALKNKGIDKLVVVSGRGAYKSTGAWDVVEKALKEQGIAYVNYDKVTPNPTVDQVDEAAALARNFGAQAVIGIGGGSPIDTAKSVAILIANSSVSARDLYELKFAPQAAAPIVAINLTHGTGTETNRFAVVSIPEKEHKPAIAYDCIYPMSSIDDPALMSGLSKEQTIYVSIDAVNHAIEAATTKTASPFSISLAKESIRLVAKYLPEILKDSKNLEARYFLLYASLLAGVSFDNGLLHFTHALEHPLSGIKPDLSHGLGLGMILPAVIKYIYKSKSATLADIFEPVIPGLKGYPDEAELVAKKLEAWLFEMGIKSKLEDEGFKQEDVAKMVNLAFTTPSLDLLLSLAPIDCSKEVVEAIFTESLTPYNK